MARGNIIAVANARNGSVQGAILTLVFAEGSRPDRDQVLALADGDFVGSRFAASHLPNIDEGWIELFASGLTFDCRGLAPAASEPVPGHEALLGLESSPSGEAISLSPGPHLVEAAGMLPVVRVLAGIGATIAQLGGVRAIAWNPARCWMPPAYFRKIVSGWLNGGPFPALGLTSLRRERDGTMQTVGLELLTGQELVFAPDRKLGSADTARIAMRLTHALLEVEPLTVQHQFTGPDGETIDVVPFGQGRRLRVSVRR